MCGGVKTPPYNAKYTPCKPVTGGNRTVSRAAYMPPLRIDQTRSQCKKRVCWVHDRGPHACGPYRARETNGKPGNGQRP